MDYSISQAESLCQAYTPTLLSNKQTYNTLIYWIRSNIADIQKCTIMQTNVALIYWIRFGIADVQKCTIMQTYNTLTYQYWSNIADIPKCTVLCPLIESKLPYQVASINGSVWCLLKIKSVIIKIQLNKAGINSNSQMSHKAVALLSYLFCD